MMSHTARLATTVSWNSERTNAYMPIPSRSEAAFVITSDAMPTVSEVMSLSPRSRSGSSGKKRMADRGRPP